MKQLTLEITNCRDCPYATGEKHKWFCALSDKELSYFENIVEKAVLNNEIPEWCELEDKDRSGEIV